ncbi:unnamed protein product [Prorocentrum cordatum]|uniref:Uncharacterized protein n=1 Tax=Prorocentrum cordatum TaxID=2364126 RepID=A0ABN9PB16_9DINO|nr:unnamed protein product [Polarella glacialis]
MAKEVPLRRPLLRRHIALLPMVVSLMLCLARWMWTPGSSDPLLTTPPTLRLNSQARHSISRPIPPSSSSAPLSWSPRLRRPTNFEDGSWTVDDHEAGQRFIVKGKDARGWAARMVSQAHGNINMDYGTFRCFTAFSALRRNADIYVSTDRHLAQIRRELEFDKTKNVPNDKYNGATFFADRTTGKISPQWRVFLKVTPCQKVGPFIEYDQKALDALDPSRANIAKGIEQLFATS